SLDTVIRFWSRYPQQPGIAVTRWETLHNIELVFTSIPNHWEPTGKPLPEADIVTKWLRECDEHDTCRNACFGGASIPTRLIDLRPIDAGCDPRLQFATNLRGQRVDYVALSYCWGTNMPQKAKTTTVNIQDRFVYGIPSSDLPPTLRDAIELTRALGIRYIWIDAVCILQDSESDWQSESAKMWQVYSAARCTLAASASADTEAGFPKYKFVDDLGPRSALLSVQASASNKTTQRICVSRDSDLKNHSTVLFESQEPLQSRGWALQERHLSPRVVYFCKDRLVWECRSGAAASYYPWCPWSPLMPETLRVFDAGRSSGDFINGRGWEKLIQEYSRRNLTHKKDKIHAIESLISALDRPGKDQYVAGHWRSGLPSSLCWRHEMSPRGDPGGRNPKRAPTWSWVSMDSAISFFEVSQENMQVEILAARSETFRDPVIGVRYEGWIRLRAQLKRFELRTDSTKRSSPNYHPDGWLFDSDNPTREADGYAFLDEPSGLVTDKANLQEVLCLQLGHEGSRMSSNNGRFSTILALMLAPTEQEGHFRRVGVASSVFADSFNSAAPSILTLV
ncbi:heterokaryon incompatibility protein-domain-containing protein, partial [Echria macrotheca]